MATDVASVPRVKKVEPSVAMQAKAVASIDAVTTDPQSTSLRWTFNPPTQISVARAAEYYDRVASKREAPQPRRRRVARRRQPRTGSTGRLGEAGPVPAPLVGDMHGRRAARPTLPRTPLIRFTDESPVGNRQFRRVEGVRRYQATGRWKVPEPVAAVAEHVDLLDAEVAGGWSTSEKDHGLLSPVGGEVT